MVDSTMAFLAPAVTQSTAAKSAHKSAKGEGDGDGGFANVLAKSSEQVSGQWGAPVEEELSAVLPGKVAKDEGEDEVKDTAEAGAGIIATGADVALMIALATAEGTVPGNAIAAATAPAKSQPPQAPDDPAAGQAAGQAVGQAACVGIKDAALELRAAAAPPATSNDDKSEVAQVAAPATKQAVRTNTALKGQGAGSLSAGIPDGETVTEAISSVGNDPSGVESLSTRVLTAGNRELTDRVAPARGDSHSAQPDRPATRSDGAETTAPADFANKSALVPAIPPVVSPQAPVQQAETSAAIAAAVSAPPPGASMHVGSGTPPITLVATHIENPGWSKDFGQHVIRLAVAGQPAAEIHLNPPDLGPIRVSIEMKGQDATLQFVAAHPQTREALEGSMPRLREIFAGSNITLASADVASKTFSDQSFGSNGQRFPQPSAAELTSQSSRTARIDDTAPVSAIASRSSSSRSRVDLFA